jgi:UDP-2,3-diacylglucosamine pyrophosphatase LpxH
MKTHAVRNIDVLVLSDIHLGTYGCHAKELLKYLKTVRPQKVILNGDIIDIWQFSKKYWPKSHMKVIKKFVKYITNEIPVYYITGNHDEMLRKFTDFDLGSFHLRNELVLTLDGKKTWFFHGDLVDVSMRYSKMLAKIGGKSYDMLVLVNRAINYLFSKKEANKIQFSKHIKQSVKRAIKFISDYEKVSVEIAAAKKYDAVVCGHIHQPKIQEYELNNEIITYINSGDWVESLTSLEYYDGRWHLYKYIQDPIIKTVAEEETEESEMSFETEEEMQYFMKFQQMMLVK